MNDTPSSRSAVTDDQLTAAITAEQQAYVKVREAQVVLRQAEETHAMMWRRLNAVRSQIVAEIKEQNRGR